jgi:hypothetical protein
MQAEHLYELFILHLSQLAFEELQDLQDQMQGASIDTEEQDPWRPTWNGVCTPKKFSTLIFESIQAHPPSKMI